MLKKLLYVVPLALAVAGTANAATDYSGMAPEEILQTLIDGPSPRICRKAIRT